MIQEQEWEAVLLSGKVTFFRAKRIPREEYSFEVPIDSETKDTEQMTSLDEDLLGFFGDNRLKIFKLTNLKPLVVQEFEINTRERVTGATIQPGGLLIDVQTVKGSARFDRQLGRLIGPTPVAKTEAPTLAAAVRV